jgi:hypothetical protein
VRQKPEQERKNGTKEEESNDRKIDSHVLAAVDDVSGESSEAEREFAAEIEEGTDEEEEAAEEQQGAAEFAERLHSDIIEVEAGWESTRVRR